MPRQPGKPWTPEEDDVLKRFMRENRKYSWAEIIKQGNLKGRTPKSCSHRWHQFLKSNFKRGKFSLEEDEQIINLKRRGESWASIARTSFLFIDDDNEAFTEDCIQAFSSSLLSPTIPEHSS